MLRVPTFHTADIVVFPLSFAPLQELFARLNLRRGTQGHEVEKVYQMILEPTAPCPPRRTPPLAVPIPRRILRPPPHMARCTHVSAWPMPSPCPSLRHRPFMTPDLCRGEGVIGNMPYGEPGRAPPPPPSLSPQPPNFHPHPRT